MTQKDEDRAAVDVLVCRLEPRLYSDFEVVGCDLLLRNRSAGVENCQKRRLGVPAFLACVRKTGTDFLRLAGRSRGFHTATLMQIAARLPPYLPR